MLNTIIKEIKELCVNKRIWIGILTVLIIIIIGTSYNVKTRDKTATEKLKLGVINQDDSAYSKLLLSYFNSSETFTEFCAVKTGESITIKDAFDNGELDAYLEIPQNFAQNMIKLEHSPIVVTINTADMTKAILFQNVLKSYEKYIAAVEANAVGLYEIMSREGRSQDLIEDTNMTVSLDLITTALGKEAFFSYEPLEHFPSTTLVNYYISSLLVIILQYTGLYIGFQVLNEMRQGTFARLRTTQTPLYQLLIAKIIIMVLLLMLSITITISVLNGKLITKEGILFGLALSLFSLCQAVFLCAFFRTTQRFILVGNLLIFFFAVLGGGIIPIQFLPQNMLAMSRMTPNFYMMKGILTITGEHNLNVNDTSFGFILMSVFLYGIAVLLFQKRSVIYDEA